MIETVSLFNLNSVQAEYVEGTETVKIKTPDHDEGFGLLVKNSNTSSDAQLRIKGGNSVMSMGDSLITLPKGTETIVNFKNTGRFKKVHGDDAGYIVIEVEDINPVEVLFFSFCI